jgi:rhomboid family GlyGly-CTERM serine protease
MSLGHKNTMGQISMPMLVSVLAALGWLYEPTSSEYFAYIQTDIHKGQIWRIITANFLHTNTSHLLLNLAGLWLLFALHRSYYSTKWLGVCAFLCVGVGIGIFVFSPKLHWYVGLSGVLHGLFVIGAFFDIRNGLKSGWLLLGGIAIKIGHESLYGASDDIARLIDAKVATDAHLYGTLAGTILIAYLILSAKTASKTN